MWDSCRPGVVGRLEQEGGKIPPCMLSPCPLSAVFLPTLLGVSPALLPSLPLFVDVVLVVMIPASLSLADKLVVVPTSLNEGGARVMSRRTCIVIVIRRCPHCGARGRPRGVEIVFSWVNEVGRW